MYYRAALPTVAAGGSGTTNPHIDLDHLGLSIVREVTPLAPPPGVDRLLCGVNSFGIGGSNAFALLAGADIAPYAVHGGGAG